ncbi:MAG TPA: serine hydrolase domain-containing protein [Pseudogracilibacillus sp.]|nr:serine hydrolase domain-containing protein [Pseudogracilibacillus sp.]
MLTFPELEKAAQSLLNKYHVPGCIIAIAKDGEVVYEHSFGYRDIESQAPIHLDTVFGLASLTKSFTCAAIMKLAEAGKLSLEDPITKHLPMLEESEQAWLKKITIHHLMTHTSGLPPLNTLDKAMTRKRNQTYTPDYGEMPDDPESLATYEGFVDYLLEQNLSPLTEPGALFSYSNEGYSLLGAIIANVSGQSYESYVIDTIIKPAGLERTSFTAYPDIQYKNSTTCYEKQESTNIVYPVENWWDAPAMRATGFLKSTARDMLHYADLYMNSRYQNTILHKKSSASMVYPHTKMDPFKSYGYGFEVTKDGAGRYMISHGGSLSSISSNFAILPHEKVAAIVLTNLSGFPASRLLQMMLQAFFNENIDVETPKLKQATLSLETMNTYVGNYTSAEGMACTFLINEQGVAEFWFQEEAYPFLFINENTLVAIIDDTNEPVEFLKEAQGNIWALSIFHRILLKKETNLNPQRME